MFLSTWFVCLRYFSLDLFLFFLIPLSFLGSLGGIVTGVLISYTEVSGSSPARDVQLPSCRNGYLTPVAVNSGSSLSMWLISHNILFTLHSLTSVSAAVWCTSPCRKLFSLFRASLVFVWWVLYFTDGLTAGRQSGVTSLLTFGWKDWSLLAAMLYVRWSKYYTDKSVLSALTHNLKATRNDSPWAV